MVAALAGELGCAGFFGAVTGAAARGGGGLGRPDALAEGAIAATEGAEGGATGALTGGVAGVPTAMAALAGGSALSGSIPLGAWRAAITATTAAARARRPPAIAIGTTLLFARGVPRAVAAAAAGGSKRGGSEEATCVSANDVSELRIGPLPTAERAEGDPFDPGSSDRGTVVDP